MNDFAGPPLRRAPTAEAGNALLLAILTLSLLLSFSLAHHAVVQKNVQQAGFFEAHSDLHQYAELGIALAIHDLRYNVSGNEGNIGTEDWTLANDLGRDGVAGTGDDGEGDGIPTPGEPNVFAVSVGPTALSAVLAVHVFETGYAGVQRIVATCSNPVSMATAEEYTRRTVIEIPRVSAVFVDPTVALDLKGKAFRIDGNDHNPDGTPGGGEPLAGITTAIGDSPGENQAALLAQISNKQYDQITGAGGSPSLGEVAGVELEALIAAFRRAQTDSLAPGTYTNQSLGNWSSGDLRIHAVDGDLHLSGNSHGAGVLIVDGSLTISGSFNFTGLIIVRGDVRLTGGGSGVQVYGSVLVGESITAIDVGSDMSVSGTADLFYSSQAMEKVQSLLYDRPVYTTVYYNDK
jgi:hypothetical protein